MNTLVKKLQVLNQEIKLVEARSKNIYAILRSMDNTKLTDEDLKGKLVELTELFDSLKSKVTSENVHYFQDKNWGLSSSDLVRLEFLEDLMMKSNREK